MKNAARPDLFLINRAHSAFFRNAIAIIEAVQWIRVAGEFILQVNHERLLRFLALPAHIVHVTGDFSRSPTSAIVLNFVCLVLRHRFRLAQRAY